MAASEDWTICEELTFHFPPQYFDSPSERYSLEINRLNREIERLSRIQQGKGLSAITAAAAAAGGSASQIRDASKFTNEHKTEQDRLKHNVDKLNTDFSRQQKRCELVLAKLEAQKHTLIKTINAAAGLIDEGLASAFLTYCVYPRFLCSPEDALFCAYFVKLMHKMKVPGFSTIEFIDGVVNAITGSLYATTEDEAGNAAIFLNELWKSTNLWRYDNDSFASELKGMVSDHRLYMINSVAFDLILGFLSISIFIFSFRSLVLGYPRLSRKRKTSVIILQLMASHMMITRRYSRSGI